MDFILLNCFFVNRDEQPRDVLPECVNKIFYPAFDNVGKNLPELDLCLVMCRSGHIRSFYHFRETSFCI